MPRRNTEGLIRLGIIALPLAGLLGLVGLFSSFKLGTGGILATGDNQAITSTGYFVSELVGNVLALTLLIFGVIALYAYLADSGGPGLALVAMVLSIFGIALALSGLGVEAYAVPALSQSFLNDQPVSITILESILTGPYSTMSTLASFLYSAGFILFGVAIWRSEALPREAGVLVAVYALLDLLPWPGPFPAVGSVIGGLLALVGGGWIALSVLRSPPAQTEAEVEPRVR